MKLIVNGEFFETSKAERIPKKLYATASSPFEEML
jgi:hypothetical protein